MDLVRIRIDVENMHVTGQKILKWTWSVLELEMR